jgi:hypothetical protein
MTHLPVSLATLAGFLCLAAPCATAGPKEYPMTGPIIAMTDTTIVVQQTKTKETWEFARTPETKGLENLKVGDQVIVRYSMRAASVEPKPEKTSKASPSPTPAAAAGASR